LNVWPKMNSVSPGALPSERLVHAAVDDDAVHAEGELGIRDALQVARSEVQSASADVIDSAATILRRRLCATDAAPRRSVA
jgi:hypothetical protein